MKTTVVSLTIQWDPEKHRDPATWDLEELLDPEGEHLMKVKAVEIRHPCEAKSTTEEGETCGKEADECCKCCDMWICWGHGRGLQHPHWEMT